MKLSLVTIASVAVLMTGCATSQPVAQTQAPQPQYQRQYVQQSAHPYAMVTETAKPVTPAPSWFTQLPQDTPDMIFAAGTASSVDEQMAYDKARLQAERKLVEMMTARVKSSTKSYRSDNGDTMSESMEVTVHKNAEGDLIGAQRVDSQATFDGKRYKVYVLLRLPLAENNALRKEREAAQAKRETALRARKAQQDLEVESERNYQNQQRADERMKKEIGVRDEPTPPAVKGPETVQTSDGEVKLMDVNNAEYKQRRDAALQKDGAVIGNSTVR